MRRWEVLEALVKEHGWTRGAELGVFEGKTFFHLLDSCPDLELLGVDTWRPGDPERDIPESAKKRPGDSGYRSYSQFPLDDYAVEVITRATAYNGRAQVLRMTTAEASYQVDAGCLDLVFLDGDHTEAGVTEDIQMWLPKIRPGGWIIGHDSDLPAVRRAIDDVLPGWRSFDDSVWAWPVNGET